MTLISEIINGVSEKKEAGFTYDELCKVYWTVILPVLADYCQVVYHSMLTDKQDQQIGGLQSRALKCIFDPGITYADMCIKAQVTTLRQRRIKACNKFATKNAWAPLDSTIGSL